MRSTPPRLRQPNGLAAALGLAAAAILALPPASGNRGRQEETPPAETAPAETPGEAPAAKSTTGERVVIRASRLTEVMGYVELEDEEVIVIRRRDNKLESFAKARIVQIIRLVDAGDGREGIVRLRNGESREGVIIDDGFDFVVVEIEGVRARFRRAVVDVVEFAPSIEDRYRLFKARLKPEMAQQHLELCNWLVRERAYALAAKEVDELLSRHTLPEALQLRRLVQAQLALAEESERKKNDAADAPRADDEPERPDDGLPRAVLTRDDVNLIRVYEIDFQNPPKLSVPRGTIARLIERYGDSDLMPRSDTERSALFEAAPIEVVELMFQLRAREHYAEIDVQSEPAALNLFRQRVHNTWLMNNCATSACHGGTNAGRLFLHRRRSKDPRVRYTNLLILERLQIDPKWPLVNYERPMDSLIIQYGLPRGLARKPHPPARGWESVFRRRDDRMIRGTIEWIESMLQPRVDYPVEFEPPKLNEPEAASTAPEAPGNTPNPGR